MAELEEARRAARLAAVSAYRADASSVYIDDERWPITPAILGLLSVAEAWLLTAPGGVPFSILVGDAMRNVEHADVRRIRKAIGDHLQRVGGLYQKRLDRIAEAATCEDVEAAAKWTWGESDA